MDYPITTNLNALSKSISPTSGPGLFTKGSRTYYDNIAFSLNIGAIVLTVILVLWSIITSVIDSSTKDSKVKEKVAYINTKLFGNSGLLNNLFGLWSVFLAAIYVIYGLGFLNSSIIGILARVDEISEKGLIKSLPIIGKIAAILNTK